MDLGFFFPENKTWLDSSVFPLKKTRPKGFSVPPIFGVKPQIHPQVVGKRISEKNFGAFLGRKMQVTNRKAKRHTESLGIKSFALHNARWKTK